MNAAKYLHSKKFLVRSYDLATTMFVGVVFLMAHSWEKGNACAYKFSNVGTFWKPCAG